MISLSYCRITESVQEDRLQDTCNGCVKRHTVRIASQDIKTAHVGGVDSVCCLHFQVTITQLLLKHWEWQEDRREDVWQGNEK